MSNTEINSLLEIAKNLESKGLYVQADKAHNIIRLSVNNADTKENSSVVQDLVSDITGEITGMAALLGAFGVANFIPFIKAELPLLSKLVNVYVLWELKNNIDKVQKLSSKFNWNKFVSGEDTTGAEIADTILALLSNFCMLANKFVPSFGYWAYIFSGLRTVFNVNRAKKLGYQLGGMPGGEAQMKQIEAFDPTAPVTDPYIKSILQSILLELGINPGNNNQLLNASKLPSPIGGLDFFIPYINKFDTQKKFKDILSDKPSFSTMQLKGDVVRLVKYIKKLQAEQNYSKKVK
jgi:hypothetical protein